jgi:hypothetical protein
MKLSPTQLEKVRYSAEGWTKILNFNFQLMNDSLLYVNALQDVSIVGLADKQVLKYSTGDSKWHNVSSGFLTSTTTTS